MTPGSTSRMKVSDRLGPCTTETPSASLPPGKPNHGELPTELQSQIRRCSKGAAWQYVDTSLAENDEGQATVEGVVPCSWLITRFWPGRIELILPKSASARKEST